MGDTGTVRQYCTWVVVRRVHTVGGMYLFKVIFHSIAFSRRELSVESGRVIVMGDHVMCFNITPLYYCTRRICALIFILLPEASTFTLVVQ